MTNCSFHFAWLPLFMFASFSCQQGEICNRPGDEDKNGQFDCEDSACLLDPFCLPESNCSNLIDDEGDGFFDCQDPECQNSDACLPGDTPVGEPCQSASDCFANEQDPFCFDEIGFGFPFGACSEFCQLSEDDCQENSFCVDVGLPGDSGLCFRTCNFDFNCPTEGYVCEDLGLAQRVCSPSCKEDFQCPGTQRCLDGLCKPFEICDNEIDDDRNGLFDCQDPTCQTEANCNEIGRCQNQEDDDFDGLFDCEDVDDCAEDPACFLEEICAQSPFFDTNATFANTKDGFQSFSGSCVGSNLAFEQIFSFTPGGGGPGILSVRLSAKDDLGLYIRTSCEDPDTQIACTDSQPGGVDERLNIPLTAATPVSIFVDGFRPEDIGPFSLFVSFFPDECGDQSTGVLEECDDGNTENGDGCDANCQLELAPICAQAIVAQASNAANTINGTNLFQGTCTGEDSPETLFALTPGLSGETGTLSLRLASAQDQGFYVRTSCEEEESEIACIDIEPAGEDEVLLLPVEGGVPLTVFVDGFLPEEEGPFTLLVDFVSDTCGDGVITGAEQCDDANQEDLDGCDANCQIEFVNTEEEPNDIASQANPFFSPWGAEIFPANDEDFLSITLSQAISSLRVQTTDLNNGACLSGTLDSVLEILDTDAATRLIFDDDSGEGFCSLVILSDVPAGTYFIRVASFGPEDTFLYRLFLEIE